MRRWFSAASPVSDALHVARVHEEVLAVEVDAVHEVVVLGFTELVLELPALVRRELGPVVRVTARQLDERISLVRHDSRLSTGSARCRRPFAGGEASREAPE